MPDSRNPLSYEATFRELAEVLAALPQEFVVPCDARNEAINFRRRFYSYIKALEHSSMDGKIPASIRHENAELARLCRSYSVTFTPDDPPALSFALRDSTPFATKMSQRIAEAAEAQGLRPGLHKEEPEAEDAMRLGEEVQRAAIKRDTEQRIQKYGKRDDEAEETPPPEAPALADTKNNPLPGTEPTDRNDSKKGKK